MHRVPSRTRLRKNGCAVARRGGATEPRGHLVAHAGDLGRRAAGAAPPGGDGAPHQIELLPRAEHLGINPIVNLENSY
jgi:hypothetical protein